MAFSIKISINSYMNKSLGASVRDNLSPFEYLNGSFS